MRPPIALAKRHTVDELQKFCKKSKDEAQKTRVRAIINIKKGKSRIEIVDLFNVNRDTVTNWVNMYNANGTEGLQTNLGGRPQGNPKWDTDIFEKLGKEIDTKKGYWSIPKMQQWILKEKKENIPEQTIWYHMHEVEDYTYKSARPHPMKGNREQQASFKKRAYTT
jgi:transposase